MFRASLATRIAILHGQEKARDEFNHKSTKTMMRNYVIMKTEDEI
jgi:hypothetical protein